MWQEIANPDGTVNSAYGHLIWNVASCGNYNYSSMETCTPWQWAVDSLIDDRDSRQAFVRFSLPEHQWHGNRDQVCTMHMNFLIRDDRLHACVVMRSQDVVRGLVYDLPFFCLLQSMMLGELREAYPNLELGEYRHLSHSMHMYVEDTDMVKRMIGEES